MTVCQEKFSFHSEPGRVYIETCPREEGQRNIALFTKGPCSFKCAIAMFDSNSSKIFFSKNNDMLKSATFPFSHFFRLCRARK